MPLRVQTIAAKVKRIGPSCKKSRRAARSTASSARNLCETLCGNRSRLYTEYQLAVEFIEFPNAGKYADDFLFGFMVADKDAVKKNKGLPPKRDSVFRMNVAVALTPYRFNAIFHQSPLNAGKS